MLALEDAYIGFTAGLLVSVLWTVTSILFTAAGKRIGATMVNAIRIVGAVGLLGLMHYLMAGRFLPEVTAEQVLYLAFSGIIGLSLGDQFLFTAFVDVGPRIAMLVMTTAPLFASGFGFIFLGEELEVLSVAGIAMTLGGVGWVVLERPRSSIGQHPPRRARGIALAVCAAVCQAAGLLLSKIGIGHGILPEEEHLDALAATLVRMSFALLGVAPILIASLHMKRRNGDAPSISISRDTHAVRVRVGLMFVLVGTIVGPFLGVWMSLVAADRAPVGVAQTLTSLSPVLILPFAAYVYREHISPRAVIGAVIAVAGIAMLIADI